MQLSDRLRRAGAGLCARENSGTPEEKLTKADMAELGLSGGADSAARRRALQKRLGLPERLSSNGLLQALNALYGRRQAIALLTQMSQEDNQEA